MKYLGKKNSQPKHRFFHLLMNTPLIKPKLKIAYPQSQKKEKQEYRVIQTRLNLTGPKSY